MKFLKKAILFLLLSLVWNNGFSQKTNSQAIDKPSEGKALVFIIRSGPGYLLNFRIYDKDKFLGAINGGQYLVYECEPGEHLFWAASENRDYIEATLEPNSIYVLHAEGQYGVLIAGVNFIPLNSSEYSDQKSFYRAIKNDQKVVYKPSEDDKLDNISKGLEKYNELKAKKSNKIKILPAGMKFSNADKPIRP